jgi:hypothetical protein
MLTPTRLQVQPQAQPAQATAISAVVRFRTVVAEHRTVRATIASTQSSDQDQQVRVIKEMIQRLQREHRAGIAFHPITNRAH